MTEHQTRIMITYREAIRRMLLMKFGLRWGQAHSLTVDYMDAYHIAMAGGDRFAFTRATRRYLKALRELSTNAKG